MQVTSVHGAVVLSSTLSLSPPRYTPTESHRDHDAVESSSTWPDSAPPYTPSAPQNDSEELSSNSLLRPPPYTPSALPMYLYISPGSNDLQYNQQRRIGHYQQFSRSAVDPLLFSGQVWPSVGLESDHQIITLAQVNPPERESYGVHLVLSCSVFWCCGIGGLVFGMIAFILAVCAIARSIKGQVSQANKIGRTSVAFSIVGGLLGIILYIVAVALRSRLYG